LLASGIGAKIWLQFESIGKNPLEKIDKISI